MSTRKQLCLRTVLVLAGVSLWAPASHARDYLSAAQQALSAGDLQTALIQLRNAVRDDPQNAEARYELAGVELALADPVSAERDVRAAAQRGLDAHKTTPLLGKSLLAQGRADDLLAQFQPTGQDPALDAVVMVLRGEADAQIGKLDEAKADFSKAETLDPAALPAWIADARLAMGRGDFGLALDRVEHALAAQPKSLDALVLKASLLQQKGDTAAARSLLDAVIADQPPALAARVERANLLIGSGKPEEAKADIDAVLKLTPGNVQALFLRAVLLHEAHDDKAAEALLQRLDPVFASYPRAYLLRATVQAQRGELHQAEESAAKYIARLPDDAGGYKLLGQIYLQDDRPDQSIIALRHVVGAGKADAGVYEMLGRAYGATGQPAAAAQSYAKTAELVPGNIGVATELAGALIASGEADAALAELEQSLTKTPASPALQDAVVTAALATGDLGKADKALAQVKTLGGDTPVTQNLTAAVQLARLDGAGAQATLERTVSAAPDFIPAQVNLARALVMQAKGQQAEALLIRLLDRSPTAEPALAMLVGEQVRTNRASQAVALMERAHAAAPADIALTVRLGVLYLQTGAAQKALDLARSAQPAAAAPNADLLLLAARADLALKKTDEARDALTRLVELEPRAVEVRSQLAGLLVQAGDYEAARGVIRDGMRATPRVYRLFLEYALIDLKASGLPRAIEAADALRREDAGFEALGALKGDVYLAAGQLDAAVQAYTEAAATAPSWLLVERLTAAYARQGRRDEARAAVAAWVGQHPDDASAIQMLGDLDIEGGKLDLAETELKAVLAKQPRNPVALNNLAWLYQIRGDAQARPTAEQAYLLDPTPQSADTLGWILTRGGDPKHGLVLLRQAAAAGDPRIAYHLGVALNDVGRKDDAVKVLKAVAGTQGDFTEKTDAQHLLGQLTKGS